MSRVRFTPTAEADLDGICAYIAERDPDAALRLVRSVRQRCRILGEQPRIGRLRPEYGLDRRAIAIGRYVVFYRLHDDEVEILRVVHGARDLDRIF